MCWKKIQNIVSLVSILVAGGCMDLPEPSVCPSGIICPPGMLCSADQNTCILSGPCGNGSTDVGEACDDGNQTSGDGCSADCTSEKCDHDLPGDCALRSCSISAECSDGVCLGGSCVPDSSRLTAGGAHTCLLLEAGAVRCWGYGDYGQLGYGNTDTIGDDEARTSVRSIDVGETIIQIAAGNAHTCALLDTGTVRCWGNGVSGQLGYGNTNTIGDDEAPASAGNVDVGGTVIQVAAGHEHTCALLNTGVVRCWGNGVSGRLGYGNTNTIGDDEAPASAGNVDVGGTAIQIAAGEFHTCALLDTGTVRCWGYGYDGQLGYGNRNTIGDDETPSSADNVNVGGAVIQITAGGSHTCALLDTGIVHCWGEGAAGQIGYGNTNAIGDDEVPASAGNVDVGGGTVIQLAAGYTHTCALLAFGTVRCWGNAYDGRLGYGNRNTIGDNETPASAGDVNLGGTATQLAAGESHTCALLSTGAMRCWGSGASGQLGYGNTNTIGDNEAPASAGDVKLGDAVIQLAAGAYHTCVLLDTDGVRCWGHGGYGQLGYGNTRSIGKNTVPAAAGGVDVGGNVIQLAAGYRHSCALLDTGAVRCWGDGGDGQLGYGNRTSIGDNETPASAGNVDVGGTVIQVTAGHEHTCALLDTGAVRCWGYGYSGRLGYGNITTIGDDETPASAGNVDVGGNVIQLAAGDRHTCALLNTGAVRCWGYGYDGQLGYGNTNTIGDNEPPASAGNVDVGGNVIQLAAGEVHTCALLDTGAVRCWGQGYFGQLGYGNTRDIGDGETPASVGDVDVGGNVTQLAAGRIHTCALLDTGTVRCWGNGYDGQLGYGNTNTIGDNEPPASAGNVDVGGDVIQLAAGRIHTCALLDASTVRCWGNGYSGQLGYGNRNTIGDDEAPASAGDVAVAVADSVLLRAAGMERTCGLLDTRDAQCWSDGLSGQFDHVTTSSIGDNETPASADNVDGSLLQGASGFEHAGPARHRRNPLLE
jgi:cysteine-rich repeat protein